MLTIIQEYLLSNYLYLQLIPALLGLVFLHKMEIGYKLFVGLLWLCVFTELAALYYLNHISETGYNKIFYNLYNIVYFSFLLGLFYYKSIRIKEQKIILSLFVFLGIAILYELSIHEINYFRESQVISYIVGSLSVLLCVFYIFINVLLANKKVNVFTDFLFWIAIAHFIYYIGFTPIKITENFFSDFYSTPTEMLYIKVGIFCLKGILLSIGMIICFRQKTH